ncbi:MAG: nicotinate (nicotinamide) nucleotide adenylyltransferase [Desulfuromonadales bacterium]|nr:nicotinate (nicotinamide) nucleotide adenylyltransferase [Desulfuromonadales bacterium]
MKIGLMGGTFNPIHLAHLRIAEVARDLCGLDRVLFIPAADPPHKPLAGDVPFAQRCEMVRLAIAGNPAFEMSAIEGQRGGKSYSIDTIAVFSEEHPQDELFFIIGSDSFFEIGLWHRYAKIFRVCSLIVVERPGRPVTDPLAALPVAIKGEFGYTETPHMLRHMSGHVVHILKGCPLDISSTSVRSQVAANRSITCLVPPAVEAYIKNQRIYTECP